MEIIGQLWINGIFRPMLNSLIFLYTVLFHNFGLAILVFTVLVTAITYPLRARQLQATKAMSAIQPRIAEIKQKYAGDRQRINQETMKLYKQGGMNPLGCLGPFVIQFPIMIGLYQAIYQAIPMGPEGLIELPQHFYSWLPGIYSAIPINSQFLWLSLEKPDPAYILPVLVGASMWVQQKMTTLPSSDPSQQTQNTMMLWMMPMMFAFFTLNFASGLAVYWVVSNIIGIVMQYFVMGWGGLFPLRAAAPAPVPVKESAPQLAEESNADGDTGNNSKDSRRGDGDRPAKAKRRNRRGRGNRP